MIRKQTVRRSLYSLILGISLAFSSVSGVHALGSSNPTQAGSSGLQGTISSPPPKQAATISLPVNGQVFTQTPITVSGSCPNGLLVKLFSNNIFVGSVMCDSGSYSLQIDLFSGQNDLVARVYDALDQAGPDSNKVSVTFQDGQFAAFGQRISLTSSYARMGANPGEKLSWPIILSGGTGPYAISVDWGDSSAPLLQSAAFAGSLNIDHVYKSAGVYRVVVRATDTNGQTAFLQLVGVGTGKVAQSGVTGSGGGVTTVTKHVFVWWPFAVFLPIILTTFWLGKRYELQAIHRQLEEQTRNYNQDL